MSWQLKPKQKTVRWIEEKKIQRQKIHRSKIYKKIIGAA
nr:MAG TPA: hypothetical protein [Caudoviricetes sp.]